MSENLVKKASMLLDVNKDGVFDFNDVKDKRFWKYIIVTLIAIIAPVLLEALINWAFKGVADFGLFIQIFNFIIGPFIMGVLLKGGFDDYELRLKKSENKVRQLEIELRKKDVEIQTVETTNQLKSQEIEFIKKYKDQIHE